MPLHIRTKDITLNETTQAHIEKEVEKFKKYNLEFSKIYVNIIKNKKDVSVEFEIDIAHHSSIVINQNDEKLDVAIDLASQRVQKALRRLHDKIKSPKHETIKEVNIYE
jgi:putative sigma-54 modulation protein